MLTVPSVLSLPRAEEHPQYGDYLHTAIAPLGRLHALRHAMRTARHARTQSRMSALTGWPAPDQLQGKCPAAPIQAAAEAALHGAQHASR